MIVSRDNILGYEDAEIDRVFVKEFGGDVCVGLLSASEVEQMGKVEGIPTMVVIAILGACDETGKRLFTMKDAPALSKKPAKALALISNKVLEFNGQTGDAQEELKNGSSEIGSDGFSSVSLDTSDAQLAN